MKPIKVIIFDLGKVIVDLSHYEMAACLAERSTTPRFQSPSTLLSEVFECGDPLTQPFDEGKISSEEFFQEAKNRLQLDLSFEEFSKFWNTSFKENRGVTQLVERLFSRYRIFLLSNTNPLHYNHLKKTVPVLNKMDQTILSFEVGCLKPSPLIFEVALKRANVPPQQILFIDDSPINIDGAGKMGIHGIVFRSPEDLGKTLASYNINSNLD